MSPDLSAEKTKIMLIDDSEEDLVLLERILSPKPYELYSFLDGEEAFNFAKMNQPDLVLLDVNMPGMDGYEVCKLFQSHYQLKTIPIIFLSGRTATEDKVKGFEAGGVDFISKPLQKAEIHARLDTHLRIHSLLRKQVKDLEASCAELRKLEALRDTFVHMTIHDMRSPLSVISGFLYLLKKDIEKGVISNRMREYVDDIVYSSNSLQNMMNNVLDVSKMETEKIDLEKKEFDIVSCIHNVVKRIYLPDSMPKLELNIPDNVISTRGNVDFVERTIQNLLSNSLKFAPRTNGYVQLSLESDPQSITIRVKDNGPGIPPGEKDHLFNKFWTGNAKQNGHRYSIGLGLSFCKMAVEAHQGKIGVEIPDPPETGITFWFQLPRDLQ